MLQLASHFKITTTSNQSYSLISSQPAMGSREFSGFSLKAPELKGMDNGYTAEKAQEERDGAKNLFLTLRDVFSEIEKFISEVNPGLIEAWKGGSETKPLPPTSHYLHRVDALLENSLENDGLTLDPDWHDLLPNGVVAKPKDNKRFDIGMGQYQFTIRQGRRVDVEKLETLSEIIKLRRKLGYAMSKRSHSSQARTASFVKPTKKRPFRTKIEWMPAFYRNVINSLLDESVRNFLGIVIYELTYYTG